MGPYLNIIATALFIIWILAYFVYNGGENIHIFLLSAIILFLVKTLILFPSKENA